MSDDILDRVDYSLEEVTDGPWEVNHDDPSIWSPEHIVIGNYAAGDEWNSRMWEDGTNEDRKFMADARTLVPELADALRAARAENERLRSYKSLPSGMVWQDYYSPDDVCKIREQLDAEIERLRNQVEGAEVGASNTQVLLAQAADDYDALVADNERLQQFVTIVERFIAERTNFITAIKNCAPDNTTDYWRWQGHAEARQTLSVLLPPDTDDSNESGDH